MPLTLDGAAHQASSSSSSSVWPLPQQLATAGAAAKRLLSEQQDNFWLYDAYGCCEAAMGKTKTARKVLESALTLATSAAAANARAGAAETDAAAAAAAVGPLLALHLAQLELSALSSSKGAAERAHAALHACLAGEPYNAPSAAAAAAVPGQQQQQQGLLVDKPLTKARRGFQDRIPQLLATAGGSLTPAAAATVAAAALFELTVGLLSGRVGKGLDAAAAVYKQVTSAVPESVRAASQQHERLQVLHCQMLVAAAVGAADALVPPLAAGRSVASSKKTGTATSAAAAAAAAAAATAASLVAAVTPARARSALAAALQLHPNSQPLLNLQVWLDHSCHTLAGLRRQLAALADLNPSPGLWGIVLQAEGLRPGGRVRMRALFERALAAPAPLTWHQQQRLQRQQQQRAWAAALAELPAIPQQQQQQEEEGGKDEQRQRRLLAAATSASEAAAQLELPLQDSYRGWGSCGSIWLCYIQFELGLGRQEAARRLFLRALHECPGFKALWLAGFRALAEGLNPREASGLMSAMQEREVLLRADVYEVLLADMAEQQQ
jgi:hypothetical protein